MCIVAVSIELSSSSLKVSDWKMGLANIVFERVCECIFIAIWLVLVRDVLAIWLVLVRDV